MDLFVYGTLMVPYVMRAVSAYRASGSAATLRGYRRRRLVGTSYPAIVEDASEQVDGILYRDLSLSQIALLDDFEGEYYRRETVEVFIGANSLIAECYILAAHADVVLSDELWSCEDFVESHLQRFIADHPDYFSASDAEPAQ